MLEMLLERETLRRNLWDLEGEDRVAARRRIQELDRHITAAERPF